MKFYAALASALQAKRNSEANSNFKMASEWDDYIAAIVKEHAPSGSGFDSGTTFDEDHSRVGEKGEVLVFGTAFHHMNEAGMYDGWTEHTVRMRPMFGGLDVRVSGRNRNDIKEYIAEQFLSLGDATPMTLAEFRNT